MILQNKLGKSDITVSALALGCMSLQSDDTNADMQCIRHAYDNGVTHFDTADLYGFGANEILLGAAVSSFRNNITLATKVGNEWNDSKSSWRWNVKKDYILKAVESSLSRLKTDYIDLYQIHGGTIDDNFDEVIETMEILVQQGKIRAYGISSIRPNVFTYYASNTNIASNMMQYSMLDTRPNKYLPMLKKDNVAVISRGGLAQGLLVGKPSKSYLTHSHATVTQLQHRIKELALKLEIPIEAIPLAYSLQNPLITSTLIGPRNMEQLRSLINIYDIAMKIDVSSIDIPFLDYTDHLV